MLPFFNFTPSLLILPLLKEKTMQRSRLLLSAGLLLSTLLKPLHAAEGRFSKALQELSQAVNELSRVVTTAPSPVQIEEEAPKSGVFGGQTKREVRANFKALLRDHSPNQSYDAPLGHDTTGNLSISQVVARAFQYAQLNTVQGGYFGRTDRYYTFPFTFMNNFYKQNLQGAFERIRKRKSLSSSAEVETLAVAYAQEALYSFVDAMDNDLDLPPSENMGFEKIGESGIAILTINGKRYQMGYNPSQLRQVLLVGGSKDSSGGKFIPIKDLQTSQWLVNQITLRAVYSDFPI